jgi:hypothetical protein
MQRLATVAATFRPRIAGAQPMTTRGTSGVQALHRPTRQILHTVFSRARREKQRGESFVRAKFSPKAMVPSRKIHTICSAAVAWKYNNRAGLSGKYLGQQV